MDKELISVLFALLRFEIAGTSIDADVKNLITDEMMQTLYKVSKKHDVAHLVGSALFKNGLIKEGSIAQKYFIREQNMAVFRYVKLQNEIDCIVNTFQTAKIPFILLKGSVIRQLYPEPWMRTSCDIDVLVEEENLHTAIDLLGKNLLYKCTKIDQHDAQLFSEEGTHIELHYSLLESGSKEAVIPVLNSVWNCVDKEQINCVMPDDLFYCYIVSHIAKHLKFGGCGVRALLDIWVLNNTIDYDKQRRDETLKKAELFVLAQELESLSKVWFNGETSNELNDVFAEYILTGGVYGTFENKVSAQQTRKKNKISYLFSRVFIPYKQMKYKYPTLQKYPILYPYYIVKRFFLLFKKDTKEKAKKELKQTIGKHSQNEISVSSLLKKLDI